MRLLFLGDIVGEPGRTAAKKIVAAMLAENAADFIVVNGENAAHGRGITATIAIDLLRAGVAVITTGDHDDRVVPHHSYRYAAKLMEVQTSAAPIYLHTNLGGSHAYTRAQPNEVIRLYENLMGFLMTQLSMQ